MEMLTALAIRAPLPRTSTISGRERRFRSARAGTAHVAFKCAESLTAVTAVEMGYLISSFVSGNAEIWGRACRQSINSVCSDSSIFPQALTLTATSVESEEVDAACAALERSPLVSFASWVSQSGEAGLDLARRMPVIPANAGIQGVVELTASVSPYADARSPSFASRFVDNHDDRVVAHWIPAFAGITSISYCASMAPQAADALIV